MSYRIINGDSAKELKKFNSESIDAVITDPPYGIEFLAKDWDSNTGAVEIWQECLRVLKPGGFLLAFSAPRTYHILATNIQSVGFEIRDQIMWLYASGFPKAQDIGKAIQRRQGVEKTKKLEMGKPGCATRKSYQGETGFSSTNQETIIPTSPEAQKWSGWKTALKPGHEPICLARKPFKGSAVDNVLEHGVGALNIDATRIPSNDLKIGTIGKRPPNLNNIGKPSDIETSDEPWIPSDKGRFPSNVIGEVEGYQKYFYCPKVSRKERHRGFEQNTIPAPFGDVKGCYKDGERFAAVHQKLQDPLSHIEKPFQTNNRIKTIPGKTFGNDGANLPSVGNNHPTVKPVALMKYLIKLVAPNGSHIIDPFMGSGTTGMAAKELGITFTGIEMDKNYCDIAKRRIDASKADQFEKLFDDTIVNE